MLTEKIRRLLKAAESVEMTSEDWERQRRSFAYGNCNIENDLVTMEMIDEEADRQYILSGKSHEVESSS
jgi:hypothetical protein